MMLMCGQSNQVWHYLAGAAPGRVGTLMGPSYWRKVPPRWWMPFALDNDAFMAWKNGTEWDEVAWLSMLKDVRMTGLRPLWALCPDKVADKTKTMEMWGMYSGKIKAQGWEAAFACQDGMTPDDVPPDADLIFIGGTDGWKYPSLPMWCSHFMRVHVGRVNSIKMVRRCEELGCESVDGSGWFRDTHNGRRAKQVVDWATGEIKDVSLELELIEQEQK